MEKKRRWSDSFAENTMVERRQACKKHFSVFFLQKPDYRPYIFSLHKTAHFLIKQCICSARQKFFGPGPQGKILGGICLLPMESDGKFAGSIFWSGATGQDFSRSKILQAMKSLPQVFLGPGLRGKLFRGAKFRKR